VGFTGWGWQDALAALAGQADPARGGEALAAQRRGSVAGAVLVATHQARETLEELAHPVVPGAGLSDVSARNAHTASTRHVVGPRARVVVSEAEPIDALEAAVARPSDGRLRHESLGAASVGEDVLEDEGTTRARAGVERRHIEAHPAILDRGAEASEGGIAIQDAEVSVRTEGAGRRTGGVAEGFHRGAQAVERSGGAVGDGAAGEQDHAGKGKTNEHDP